MAAGGSTVWLVRHASAGDPSAWERDDRERPLDERGIGQAQGLLAALTPHGVRRARSVRSSPFLRCRQTVEPLAASLGLEVLDDPALAEGAPRKSTIQLIRRCGDAVLCSHGDVIGDLVGHLVARGLAGENARFAKGSTWVLEIADGHLGGARYVVPAVR